MKNSKFQYFKMFPKSVYMRTKQYARKMQYTFFRNRIALQQVKRDIHQKIQNSKM